MNPFIIALIVLASIALLVILTAFICYLKCFYSPSRKPVGEDEYPTPDGEIYEPYHSQMVGWIKKMRAHKSEDIEIKSFDGLTLRGKYFHGTDDSIIEIMLHGYRGSSERDMCGGIQRAFALEHNVLLVDQRASGRSDGHTITFGIRERYDVLSWINYAIEKFGPDCRIMLTGISMGGATVMMASELDLPKNVIGILEDCGYTSPKEIISKVIRDMKLPVGMLYPFVKLGARLFGGFDLDSASAIEAVKKSPVPIIFVHGEDDAFVPCEMSIRCYEACTAPKMLHTVPDAGHGLAYIVENEDYIKVLEQFEKEYLNG